MKIEELNLNALKYFIDAVETGSISKSSQLNYVSRPAVSQAILRLGDWYGKKLLVHEKRNFILSPAGEEFYRKAKNSLTVLKTNFDSKIPNSKTFKIGFSASLVEIVKPTLKPFLLKAESPILKLGTTDQILQSLKSKEINLAITVDKNNEFDLKSNLIRKGHFYLYSKTGELEDILLTTEERPETRSLLTYMNKKKIQAKTQIQVESWSVIGQLAHSLSASSLLPDYLHPKGFWPVDLKDWKATYSVKAYFRNPIELSYVEKDFLDKLKLYNLT